MSTTTAPAHYGDPEPDLEEELTDTLERLKDLLNEVKAGANDLRTALMQIKGDPKASDVGKIADDALRAYSLRLAAWDRTHPTVPPKTTVTFSFTPAPPRTKEPTDWVEVVEKIAEEVGGTVRDDYSGRAMYGTTCYGIVCEDPDACLEEAASRGLRGGRTDSMGRRSIVYWPRVKGRA